MYDDEGVQIRLNGHPVEIIDHYEEPRKEMRRHGTRVIKGGGYWFEVLVDTPPMWQGLNYAVVSGKGGLAFPASSVENVQLWVRHKSTERRT